MSLFAIATASRAVAHSCECPVHIRMHASALEATMCVVCLSVQDRHVSRVQFGGGFVSDDWCPEMSGKCLCFLCPFDVHHYVGVSDTDCRHERLTEASVPISAVDLHSQTPAEVNVSCSDANPHISANRKARLLLYHTFRCFFHVSNSACNAGEAASSWQVQLVGKKRSASTSSLS